MLSTTSVARLFMVPEWKVRRLYETRVLPEPQRVSGRRLIDEDQLPTIEQALRDKGWLE